MRTRVIRKVRPGTAPGALEAPEQRVDEVTIDVLCYGPDDYAEMRVEAIEEALGAVEDAKVTWINIVGVHDVDLLAKVGEHFGIHPLALEDVVNIGQRPKLESQGEHLFVIMRLLHLDELLEVEQISLFFGPGYVLTLQEIAEGDPFDPVREGIRNGSGNVRTRGSDYLAYLLLDILVDSLYPVLEKYGEQIERMEAEMLDRPSPKMLERVQRLKRDLLWIRRTAWPHREVVHALERLEHPLIGAETRRYLADCYDHCVQLMDVTETFRDLASGLNDLYLTTNSNRMNEIMKVLTIMASIFIPLTFIAGIYGMNFNPETSELNMPELNWAFGYPAALTAMGVIAVVMVAYFRIKRWL